MDNYGRVSFIWSVLRSVRPVKEWQNKLEVDVQATVPKNEVSSLLAGGDPRDAPLQVLRRVLLVREQRLLRLRDDRRGAARAGCRIRETGVRLKHIIILELRYCKLFQQFQTLCAWESRGLHLMCQWSKKHKCPDPQKRKETSV